MIQILSATSNMRISRHKDSFNTTPATTTASSTNLTRSNSTNSSNFSQFFNFNPMKSKSSVNLVCDLVDQKEETQNNSSIIMGGDSSSSKSRVTSGLSRGLSRIFRRHNSKTYNVSKIERRSLSEYNLTRNDSFIEDTVVDKAHQEEQQHFEKIKSSDSWVVVHKLKTQSDGGILDPDDKLTDVADDREQIMAIYEEENDGIPSLQMHHHNAGDGTSASSVGTNSPDIFQGSDHKFQPFVRTDIEITGEELNDGSSPNGGLMLQVRRGSEPALNRLSPVPFSSPPDPSKRWSAAPIIDDRDKRLKDLDQEGSKSSPADVEVVVELQQQQGQLVSTMKTGSNHNLSGGRENSVISNKTITNSSINAANTNTTTTSNTNNNNMGPLNTTSTANSPNNSSVILRNKSNSSNISTNSQHLNKSHENSSNSNGRPSSRFFRDQNRLSMQFSSDNGYKWQDSAERVALSISQRKEPVGGSSPEASMNVVGNGNGVSNSNSQMPNNTSNNYCHSSSTNGYHEFDIIEDTNEDNYDDADINEIMNQVQKAEEEQAVYIILPFELGPLGIHVVPDHTAVAQNQGMIVQGVEPGGRIDRDGRLQAKDKIIEINGQTLIGVPFQKAQDLFREGLNNSELRLKVVKCRENIHGIDPSSKEFFFYQNQNQQQQQQQVVLQNGDNENMIQSHEKIVGDAKIAHVSPTKKMPLQAIPLTRPCANVPIIASNTRKIGRKYEIDLKKGLQGLGFSITTRDNPAGGNCPIYIKNILPTGAAIDDGRLRPGDRLLEVNGIEITGKSQSESVQILRNVPLGGIVKLIVSRQERVDLSPKLPRQIPPEKAGDGDLPLVPFSEREIITLDIPILETEKAGLGISVKGKTTATAKGSMVDNGIYIKSVIHGGAASRDMRLKPNDQLLNVNGITLLDRSNTDAMETLRKTMTMDGPKPKPGFITLTIARRVPSSSAPTTDGASSASGDDTEFLDSWESRNISISVDGNIDGKPDIESSILVNGTGDPNHYLSPIPKPLEHHDKNQDSHQNSLIRHPITNTNNSTPIQDQHHQNQDRSLMTPTSTPVAPLPDQYNSKKSIELPRNPVLDRLTGKVNNQAVRNESYYKATNETWNTTLIQSILGTSPAGPHVKSPSRGGSHTIMNAKGELVLVEDDYIIPQKPPRRSRSSTPEDGLESNRRESKQNIPTPVQSPGQNGDILPSDVTYTSQTSLNNDESQGFSRDAFGRQSISEKRHASIDAKNTDTYQRNKKLREERDRQRSMQQQQQELNDKKRAEKLAREKNLHDQLARRGVKRPFSCSTEEEIFLHDVEAPYLYQKQQQQKQKSQNQLRNSFSSFSFTSGSSPQSRSRSPTSPYLGKGFGQNLMKIVQQYWTQPGVQMSEYKQSSHRGESAGLQRVNSADSLADVINHQKSEVRSPQGKKSHKKKDIGPSLGMKKSSSLESLQTMVQEIQIQEDVKTGYHGGTRAGAGSVRVVRGRGCNESFRQAVDRSYDAPLGEGMETLPEEETESLGGHSYGQKGYPQDPESDGEGLYGGSMAGKKPSGSMKKKQGLFKGLGSMFRFGRHRKSSNSALSASEIKKQHIEIERIEKEESHEKERARVAAHSEQMRIQEQYRRLVEIQKQENRNSATYGQLGMQNNSGQNQNGQNYATYQTLRGQQGQRITSGGSLRGSQHSRKHKNLDNLNYSTHHSPVRDANGNQVPSNHPRSASYDVYNEINRPGSRVGFADPAKYTHYINYEEIRHHLKDGQKPVLNNGNANNGIIKQLTNQQLNQMRQVVVQQRQKAILESRRHQQHYHSQRRENPREKHDRPVSNFYEYESVQAAMHHGLGLDKLGQQQHQQKQPQKQQQQHLQQTQNSNQVQVQVQQQPIYATRANPNAQQQQQQQQQQINYTNSRLNVVNNNGITLPSPTSTFPFQNQQSQYHVVVPPPPNPKPSKDSSKPNSLPRKSTKEPNPNQISVTSVTSHRHPQQQQPIYGTHPQQQQMIPGRYTIANNTHSHTSIHNHNHGLPTPHQQQQQQIFQQQQQQQQHYRSGSLGPHHISHQHSQQLIHQQQNQISSNSSSKISQNIMSLPSSTSASGSKSKKSGVNINNNNHSSSNGTITISNNKITVSHYNGVSNTSLGSKV